MDTGKQHVQVWDLPRVVSARWQRGSRRRCPEDLEKGKIWNAQAAFVSWTDAVVVLLMLLS